MKRMSLVIVLLLTGCTFSTVIEPTAVEPTRQSPTQLPTQIVTPVPTISPQEAADVIFYNGVILTMNPEQPRAQAIGIRGGKIVAVGTDQELMNLKNESTKMIDLGGLTLMPGFVDAHTHLLNDAGKFGTDLDGIQQMALENGITTIGDMFVSQDFLDEMRHYNDEGRLRIRTSLYLIYNTNCGDIVGDWWKDVPPTREPGEML